MPKNNYILNYQKSSKNKIFLHPLLNFPTYTWKR